MFGTLCDRKEVKNAPGFINLQCLEEGQTEF